jgi:hypothetical protein
MPPNLSAPASVLRTAANAVVTVPPGISFEFDNADQPAIPIGTNDLLFLVSNVVCQCTEDGKIIKELWAVTPGTGSEVFTASNNAPERFFKIEPVYALGHRTN